jgi:hypothetical protein
MVLTGGKRKANKSLLAWVKFVKKVQKEEKLNYKEAIHRAKQRKDKGEKWMTGGADDNMDNNMNDMPMNKKDTTSTSEGEEDMVDMTTQGEDMEDMNMDGGRRRRRTMRRTRGKGRASGRTARRSRGRSVRRSRGRSAGRSRGRA